MPLFTPLRSVKTGTGLSAPLEQGPRQPRPSLAEPVTALAAPPSDNGPLSDAALDPPRPRPPPAGSPAGSALHNRRLCKLPPSAKPHPAPPRRAHARPTVPGIGHPPRAPGCRGPGSAAPAAPPGPRHGRRFAPPQVRAQRPTFAAPPLGRTLGAGALVLLRKYSGSTSPPRCVPPAAPTATPPAPLRGLPLIPRGFVVSIAMINYYQCKIRFHPCRVAKNQSKNTSYQFACLIVCFASLYKTVKKLSSIVPWLT